LANAVIEATDNAAHKDETDDYALKAGEAVNSCTSGTHDWETYSEGEVWFYPNGYGSNSNLSALPNPQFKC
jgi:hypothetical protein